MKYTAVVKVKIDVCVEAYDEKCAQIKAHDDVVDWIANVMRHEECDGITINSEDITVIKSPQ